MIPKIPIQNLYYLLCYIWDVPDLRNKVNVNGEKCHSPENLLATVLLNICEHLLKRGLAQSYRYEQQEVEGIGGKVKYFFHTEEWKNAIGLHKLSSG